MSQTLERDVRFLKRYASVTTAMMVVLSLAAFRHVPQNAKFGEIDAERINIVEPNGMYRMVISNRPRSIGPIYKGKPFGYKGGTRPGIIFFNDEGTENGGLTFVGSRSADGKYSASTHMSFDQFNSDQVLNLDYRDENGRRLVGFSVNDRAPVDIYDFVKARDSIGAIKDSVARAAALDSLVAPRNGVPLAAQRLFVGRDAAQSAIVNLADRNGKPRLRLVVDSTGAARIEFLDPRGRVTYSLADTTGRSR
ncbi:MAG TPA: hypothetical protein VL524_04040 [Gemmatimonadaceae bacterium]|jgi:hypothetical protein|nr:hypothetical protein [Gemmatimonadaceae bacterium]